MRRWTLITVAGLSWLGLVVLGLGLLFRYQTTPGETATAPPQWPADSGIPRTPGQATLIMTVHPQCPCTRATISELALLMASCHGRVQAHVLFYKPKGATDDWAKTDLWANAARIPGVHPWRDTDGKEARRFHATTSGQTLLYDLTGRLRFSGGITASRGHSGDNAGRAAIVAMLMQGKLESARTDVYGCLLFEPTSERICCQK